MEPIHDRMPVLLGPENWDSWLDPENEDVEGLAKLLRPAPVDAMEAFPVSKRVNSPRTDDPSCLEREAPQTLFHV